MTLARAAMCASLLALAACADSHGATHGGAEGHTVVSAVPGLPAEAEIAALFDRWNATLQTGGPHDMALLYAESGVLLPTVSNQARTNRAEIADYFEHFLALQPRGTINEQYITVLDSNTAVNSGVYTFDLVRNGAPEYVVARYSYVYEKVDGRWLITSHHSSAMPEPIPERPPSLAQRLRTAQATPTAPTAHAAPADAHGPSHGASLGPAEAHAASADHGAGDSHGPAHH